MTGPAKIGHVGSQNLTTFQTFVTHNFLLKYGIAIQFSEIVHNLTGFPKHLTELKYYTSVLRYVSSNHMVYFSPHACPVFAGPVTYSPSSFRSLICLLSSNSLNEYRGKAIHAKNHWLLIPYRSAKIIYTYIKAWAKLEVIYVTGSAKRGLIADPNCTLLETHNLTCEFGTDLKLGPNIPLA